MNDQSDSQLLRSYAEQHAEPAFTELVDRHIDFVYSAALRMVCDSHLAEDVTQGVFVALAKQARQLADRPVLSGWLHRTAQNLAAQTVRTDVRRRAREQEVFAMNELIAGESEADWKQIAPHLDAALGELSESDRDALLLRYFERKSAQEIAQTLGISDEAAQKRVSRAVERLREFFSKRNVKIGASGIAVVISVNAVQAAPIGLAATISATVALTSAAVSTSTLITTTKVIAMTTLQKSIIGAAFAVAVGAGIFEAHQASQLRQQNQTLQQQQVPLDEEIQLLQAANESFSNRLAETGETKNLSDAQLNELLKLRGEVGVLRRQTNEAGELQKENRQLQEKMNVITSTPVKQLFFNTQRTLILDAAKQLNLAIRQYAENNNGSYPTNFNEFMNIITNTMDMTPGAIGLNSFELVSDVTLSQSENLPVQILLREKISRQRPDGKWSRLYGFTDGSIVEATSDNGDFSNFEQQHMISPAANGQ